MVQSANFIYLSSLISCIFVPLLAYANNISSSGSASFITTPSSLLFNSTFAPISSSSQSSHSSTPIMLEDSTEELSTKDEHNSTLKDDTNNSNNKGNQSTFNDAPAVVENATRPQEIEKVTSPASLTHNNHEKTISSTTTESASSFSEFSTTASYPVKSNHANNHSSLPNNMDKIKKNGASTLVLHQGISLIGIILSVIICFA